MKAGVILTSLVCTILLSLGSSQATLYEYKVSGVITSISDPWGHLNESTDHIETQARIMPMLNAWFSYDSNHLVDLQIDNLFYASNVSVDGFYNDYRGIYAGFVQSSSTLLTEVLLTDDVYDHVISIDFSDMTWNFSDVFSGVIWNIGGEITNVEQINPVPEPSSIALLGTGLTALALWRKRKIRSSLMAN